MISFDERCMPLLTSLLIENHQRRCKEYYNEKYEHNFDKLIIDDKCFEFDWDHYGNFGNGTDELRYGKIRLKDYKHAQQFVKSIKGKYSVVLRTGFGNKDFEVYLNNTYNEWIEKLQILSKILPIGTIVKQQDSKSCVREAFIKNISPRREYSITYLTQDIDGAAWFTRDELEVIGNINPILLEYVRMEHMNPFLYDNDLKQIII